MASRCKQRHPLDRRSPSRAQYDGSPDAEGRSRVGGLSPGHVPGGARVGRRGLVVFDGDGRCRMIGRRAGEIFGIEPAAYVGKLRDDVLGRLRAGVRRARRAPRSGRAERAPRGAGRHGRGRRAPAAAAHRHVQGRSRSPGGEAAGVAPPLQRRDARASRRAAGQAAPGAHRRADRVRRAHRAARTFAASAKSSSASTGAARARGTATPSCASTSTGWGPSTTSSAGPSATRSSSASRPA